MTAMTPPRCVAFHEAGHAVVGWYAGFLPLAVTIVRDDDAGTAGTSEHSDAGEWGDLGVIFRAHREHGMVVEERDGTLRLPTDAERQHNDLVDGLLVLSDAERRAMVDAGGAASELIATPDLYNPNRCLGDRVAAIRVPGVTWEEWLDRTGAFLREPAVWRRVEALAALLLERKTLDGASVIRAIRAG